MSPATRLHGTSTASSALKVLGLGVVGGMGFVLHALAWLSPSVELLIDSRLRRASATSLPNILLKNAGDKRES